MLESFNRSATSVCKRASCIQIQKEALGRAFLLMASGKTGGSTPQWLDVKPLVVRFEKSGGKIALLNDTDSIYSEISTVNLIQTFEVISESEKSITFDWGSGLKTFVAQTPYDVDGERDGGAGLTESSRSSIPVIDSFIRNIKFDEKNIELEQISKVRSNSIKAAEKKKLEMEDREETLAMNIQIRSYDLDSNFPKKEFDKSRRVGFFVAKRAKETLSKDVTNLITKWDLSPSKGPIIVRISKAVPEQYVQAVKEAVYYWNKVFGKDVLVAQTGVDPQAGPENRSIFIRWIPWMDSGAAYAMGQSDPRTGELLRAQVFMPSVFTKVASADQVQLNNDVPVAVGAVACDLSKTFIDLNNLAKEADSSQRLRLAQDSVRVTVAHELGHALGLRHNFAGSFSSKISTNEILSSAKRYLNDLNHPGLETSTSIMDYVTGIDEVLMSARIKNAPLSYDKMAMDWAYSNNDSQLSEDISKYCTDDDITLANSQGMQIYGCERFDAGNNPLLRKYLNAQSELTGFTNVLFTSIIGRLYPADEPGSVKDIDQVLADTKKWQKIDFESLKYASQVIMDDTKNNQVAAHFASMDYVKAGGIALSKQGQDKIFAESRNKSLAEIGGYAALVNNLWRQSSGDIDVDWLKHQVEALKNSPYFSKGKTLGGREYQLSSDDQGKILNFYLDAVELNKKALVSGLAILLPKIDEQEVEQNGKSVGVSSFLPKDILKSNDADVLARLFLDLISLEDGAVTAKVGADLSSEITLKKSYLSADEKALWMKLLSSKGLRFDLDTKKALARKTQYDKINSFLKHVDANMDLSSIAKVEDLPDDLSKQKLIDSTALDWLKSEINVLLAFDKLN
ncbi:MAG: zinc-dependent metalloprotease [Bdellovibrio sp.]